MLKSAEVEEIKALTRRLSAMTADEMAELQAELAEIIDSPDSSQAQISYATVMGAACRTLARGGDPKDTLMYLFKMRAFSLADDDQMV